MVPVVQPSPSHLVIMEASAQQPETRVLLHEIINIIQDQPGDAAMTPRPGSAEFPQQWREILHLARVRHADTGGGAQASETTYSQPSRETDVWYRSDDLLTSSGTADPPPAAVVQNDNNNNNSDAAGTLISDIELHKPPGETVSLLSELLAICNDADVVLGAKPEVDEALHPDDGEATASESVRDIVARVEATAGVFAAARAALAEEFRSYIQARSAMKRRQAVIRAYQETLTSFLDNTLRHTDVDASVQEAQSRVCVELQNMVHAICNQKEMKEAVEDVRKHWRGFSNLRAACSPMHACDLAMTCTACMTRVSDVVFYPCGHVICSACAPSLRKCHMCRRDITTRLRIYK